MWLLTNDRRISSEYTAISFVATLPSHWRFTSTRTNNRRAALQCFGSFAIYQRCEGDKATTLGLHGQRGICGDVPKFQADRLGVWRTLYKVKETAWCTAVFPCQSVFLKWQCQKLDVTMWWRLITSFCSYSMYSVITITFGWQGLASVVFSWKWP